MVALETQAICQKTAGKRPKITSNGRLRLAYTCAVVCGCLPRFALPPPALHCQIAHCGRPNCHFRRFGSLCNVAGGIKMGVWACFSGAPPRFSPFCTHFLPFFYSLACPYYCAACCRGASFRPHFRPKKRPPGSHFAPKTRFFDETSRGQYFSNNQRITTPCSKNMSKS